MADRYLLSDDHGFWIKLHTGENPNTAQCGIMTFHCRLPSVRLSPQSSMDRMKSMVHARTVTYTRVGHELATAALSTGVTVALPRRDPPRVQPPYACCRCVVVVFNTTLFKKIFWINMIPITPYFIFVKHPQLIPLGTDTKLIVGN